MRVLYVALGLLGVTELDICSSLDEQPLNIKDLFIVFSSFNQETLNLITSQNFVIDSSRQKCNRTPAKVADRWEVETKASVVNR